MCSAKASESDCVAFVTRSSARQLSVKGASTEVVNGAHLRASVDDLHPINIADAGCRGALLIQVGGRQAEIRQDVSRENFGNGLHERGDADDAW